MGREFELKYAALSPQQEALRAAIPGSWQSIAMETTYFDTPAGELSARRITLRRRMENGVSVCTVKTPAPGGARGEWECECDSIEKAVPELCKLGAPQALLQWAGGELVPTCGARFTRQALTLELESCTVEIALDHGCLLGGGQEQPLCEVEVELKAGNDAAAVAFAESLAAKFGLKPEKRSKFRRALALAKGE